MSTNNYIMKDFLKTLSIEQLNALLNILSVEIEGDIDFLIFNIKEEIDNIYGNK